MVERNLQSIYDLAKQTGVSTSTVSRVLNQSGRISERTRHRVLTAARKAGFRPRASVRRCTIAIVTDRFRYVSYGGYVSTLLTHLVSEMGQFDWVFEVYTESNVDRLGTRFIDGVISLAWDPATVDVLRELKDVPIVAINRLDLAGISAVSTDHAQGGRLVGEHLTQQGHRRIAVLTEERDWGAMQRVAGLRQAMAARDINEDDLLLVDTGHGPVGPALKSVIDQQATALFLAGEDLSLEAMSELAKLGCRVPDNLSVVGLESERISQFLQPPLTCLRQPFAKLASASLKLIGEHMENARGEPRHVLLDNDLAQRHSVRPV